MAAGALAAYPTLISQLVLAGNHMTAAIVRHPAVADGINSAIGGAFVSGVISSGLSLGLAAGALMAALFFLAAIMLCDHGFGSGPKTSSVRWYEEPEEARA